MFYLHAGTTLASPWQPILPACERTISASKSKHSSLYPPWKYVQSIWQRGRNKAKEGKRRLVPARSESSLSQSSRGNARMDFFVMIYRMILHSRVRPAGTFTSSCNHPNSASTRAAYYRAIVRSIDLTNKHPNFLKLFHPTPPSYLSVLHHERSIVVKYLQGNVSNWNQYLLAAQRALSVQYRSIKILKFQITYNIDFS